MIRGTPITERPQTPPAPAMPTPAYRAVGYDRILDTAAANAFLGKAPGFLEKRRSSGIDCPRFIRTRPRCAVTYRVEDLLAWEEERMRRSTSER